ncbi:MAG TPA: hypothetical protein VK654_17655 [Nitrospirota bacterium]|nr:hypothetical protein [Nitrospirota bacterium]
MKTLRLLFIGMLLIATSGCFPVFVPGDGRHGDHEHYDHGDHGGGHHGDRY